MCDNRLAYQDAGKKKIHLCINTSLQVVDTIVKLTAVCIGPCIWGAPQNTYINDVIYRLQTILELLGDLLEQFRLMVTATDMEYFERVAQLHLLNSTCALLQALVPIEKSDVILPRNLKNSLSSSLLDASFGRIFPATHENLVQYVMEFASRFDTENFSKYKEVKNVCKAMSCAVRFLRNSHDKENLVLLSNSLISLEFHRNYRIIDMFFDICGKQTFVVDEKIEKVISNIIVTLMSHEDETLRKEMYSRSHKFIKNYLGINHIKSGESNTQVLLFIQPDVIVEILSHGLTCEIEDIHSKANDIMIHIIKCKFLVTEKIWKRIIASILPTFPILFCFAAKNTAFGKAVLRMMDPDICPSISIPVIDVIKGNLTFLFNTDLAIRNEAVSRLCWLLTTEKDYEQKIPKIKSLDNCALSNVFQMNHHIDVGKLKSPRQFYEVSSLVQVLQLLENPAIDIDIKRSAMQQVSVMMTDHFIHSSFLERNGLEMTLRMLHDSLLEKNENISLEFLQPCLSILKNLCLYNSALRQELALNLDLYFCLVRMFLLYNSDKVIQQDGSVLLCLLLFSEYILNCQKDKGMSLPYIVVNNLHIPFRCNTHWKTSKHMKPKLSNILLSDEWCRNTLRMHWNIEYHGGINEIINDTQPEPDFNSNLKLTNENLNALKASSVLYCCQKYLYEIQNATTHGQVIECLRGLYGYISLWLLSERDHSSLLTLPWKDTFDRFLSAPPANEDDTHLLVELLQVLILLLKLYKDDCWIKKMLFNSRHHLVKLLQHEVHNDRRAVSLELLNLISEVITLSEDQITSDTKPTQNCIFMINVFTENLKFNDSGQFYNLAYLDRLLLCLVHMTSVSGWCEQKHPEVDVNKMLSGLIEGLAELVNAFHQGKGQDASSSFMGLSITKNALIAMSHVLNEMQMHKKSWEAYWLSDSVNIYSLLNLDTLWQCRDVVVRASTLQLLAGLAISPRGTTDIVATICQGHIWETTIKVLIDHSEASVIREQAAGLLTNLCSHLNITEHGQSTLPLCHTSPVTNTNLTTNEHLLALLQQHNFYEELNILLQNLHLKSNWEMEQLSTYSPLTQDKREAVPTTPNLIKATTLFLNNLMFLSPADVSQSLFEHGSIRSLFSCLSVPSVETGDNKAIMLYCNTLEMNTALCSVLSRIATASQICHTALIAARDCLYILVSLLNTELYIVSDTTHPHLSNLKYKLWTEIFNFLTVLLNKEVSKDKNDKQNYVIPSLLTENYDGFINTTLMSIDNKLPNLQKNSLKFLTVLLSTGFSSNIGNKKDDTLSIITLFDRKDVEPTESLFSISNKIDAFINKSTLNENSMEGSKKKSGEAVTPHQSLATVMTAGESLCKSLLSLYEAQNWESNKDYKKRTIIIGALGSLLSVSEEAKKCALQEDLLSHVISNFKNLQLELSIHSVDSIRKSTDKKKVCPLLKEVDAVLGMITNFMVYNINVKKAACKRDLGDLVHKLWAWFCVDRNLLTTTLKMLCTFTSECNESCHSLILTNPAAGSGPRKTPNGISLLHVIVNLLLKEMDHVSRTRDIKILRLCFSLLRNVCSSVECRNVLAKSQLFTCFHKAHPVLTKHQKPWESIERLLLEFLLTFTYYPEGQVSLAKNSDHVELLVSLATSAKSTGKILALNVLRNMCFHQSNRPLLLSSADFVRTLQSKLVHGSNEERDSVVGMMWALAANSQRSKIVLKCAGLDTFLQDLIKKLQVHGIENNSYNNMLYVLGMLKD